MTAAPRPLNDVCVVCGKRCAELSEHACPKMGGRCPIPAAKPEPIVVADEGVEIRGAGIVQAQPESLDELAEAWHHFGREIEHGTWGRMAVVARVRRFYGEGTLEEFARIVGTHPSTVCRLLKVHDSFADGSLRRRNDDTVTFWHYVEALKAPEPEKAIEAAAEEKLSVRKLRERVDALRPPKKPKALPAPKAAPPAYTSVANWRSDVEGAVTVLMGEDAPPPPAAAAPALPDEPKPRRVSADDPPDAGTLADEARDALEAAWAYVNDRMHPAAPFDALRAEWKRLDAHMAKLEAARPTAHAA